MRCLIQRVSRADVKVENQTIGEIGPGLMILVCAMQGDDEAQAVQLANKVTSLRIFSDENGKMNRSLLDIEGQALIVSQFTLAADTSRGNRPGFSSAAPPDLGNQLYERFAVLVMALASVTWTFCTASTRANASTWEGSAIAKP